MRLGGSVMKPYSSPKEWLQHVKELGYSAVIFPVESTASAQTIRDYAQCCRDNDLLIGEVGAWRNVMARDPKERAANLDWNIRQLELAETVGANCCVNISGSTGDLWDGYDPILDTCQVYDLVVENTRRIIDAVKPTHTAYSLEPMPWMVPESPEQYLQLMKDVDRAAFKVHLDYCNMLNSIDRYRHASEFITKCFTLLGEHIVSIHAKDAKLADGMLPIQINEVAPGEGSLDLPLVTKLAHGLGEDTPVFVEHLPDHAAYMRAAAVMREAAKKAGIPVK
ncbi:MAG: sugar phosphate isomerase/epimerase [Clostridiales bacterium]|nr:sugar phosphate isomerase/epimerase [Clostridiales bacterium]